MATLAFPPCMVIGDSHNSTIRERVRICQKEGITEIKLKEEVTMIFLRAVKKKSHISCMTRFLNTKQNA
jgi:hypothetical protein